MTNILEDCYIIKNIFEAVLILLVRISNEFLRLLLIMMAKCYNLNWIIKSDKSLNLKNKLLDKIYEIELLLVYIGKNVALSVNISHEVLYLYTISWKINCAKV